MRIDGTVYDDEYPERAPYTRIQVSRCHPKYESPDHYPDTPIFKKDEKLEDEPISPLRPGLRELCPREKVPWLGHVAVLWYGWIHGHGPTVDDGYYVAFKVGITQGSKPHHCFTHWIEGGPVPDWGSDRESWPMPSNRKEDIFFFPEFRDLSIPKDRRLEVWMKNIEEVSASTQPKPPQDEAARWRSKLYITSQPRWAATGAHAVLGALTELYSKERDTEYIRKANQYADAMNPIVNSATAPTDIVLQGSELATLGNADFAIEKLEVSKEPAEGRIATRAAPFDDLNVITGLRNTSADFDQNFSFTTQTYFKNFGRTLVSTARHFASCTRRLSTAA